MSMTIERGDNESAFGGGHDTRRWHKKKWFGPAYRPIDRWIHAWCQRAVLVVCVELNHHGPVLGIKGVRDSGNLCSVGLSWLGSRVKCNGHALHDVSDVRFRYRHGKAQVRDLLKLQECNVSAGGHHDARMDIAACHLDDNPRGDKHDGSPCLSRRPTPLTTPPCPFP